MKCNCGQPYRTESLHFDCNNQNELRIQFFNLKLKVHVKRKMAKKMSERERYNFHQLPFYNPKFEDQPDLDQFVLLHARFVEGLLDDAWIKKTWKKWKKTFPPGVGALYHNEHLYMYLRAVSCYNASQ